MRGRARGCPVVGNIAVVVCVMVGSVMGPVVGNIAVVGFRSDSQN
jgi:hypothetical protein